MQITIPEVEIKVAITDYIKRQVNLREDQLIDIDLKATRGIEGYQAIINITSPEHAEVYAANTATATKPSDAPAAKAEEAAKTDSPLKIVEKVEAAKEKPAKPKAKLFTSTAAEVQTAELEKPAEDPPFVVDDAADEPLPPLDESALGSEALDPAFAPETTPVVEAAPVVAEAANEDAPTRPSIFAAMVKPVNAKAEEAQA